LSGVERSVTHLNIYRRQMMRIARALFASLVLAAIVPTFARAQAEPKPADKKIDLTGKWAFTVQSDVGNGTPTVTFSSQKGDSISGRYSSQALGEHDFVGTFKDGKLAFGFTAEAGGQSFSMSFAGKVDNNDEMTGSIDFAGMATGSFYGKRVKPPFSVPRR
jgi:hypothetical protein